MKLKYNKKLSEEYFSTFNKITKIVTIDEEEFKKRCEESNNKEKENGKH